MFLFQFFRSFQPLQNPLGFGASDWIEFALALLLLLFALLWRPFLEPLAQRLARRTALSMVVLALLPIGMRLALLPNHPAPAPDLYDEFSHLLVADTLLHFRLANPPHALPEFFETFFVLQEPTYSSIYPLGQGLAMALGRLATGLAWGGVVLFTGAFCAALYWMLRAWTTPGWALAGGVLAVLQFGPLSQWMNSYWGGAFAATAGCLVFGALPRLAEHHRIRDGLLLGAGLAMHLLTRPFESTMLFASAAVFLAPGLLRKRQRYQPLVAAAALIVAALGLIVLQNKQVTGSWTTMPYMLSRYQYGVPAAFTFEADPVPHRELTPQQQMGYQMQKSFRGEEPETVKSYLLRLLYRVRYYRFYFLPPLYLALLAFLLNLRRVRYLWVAGTLLLFALGTNFFPAFQFHYVAGVTCLLVLTAIAGLERMSAWRIRGFEAGLEAARLLLFVCVAQFLFWYGLHLFEGGKVTLAIRQFETWTAINHGEPSGRIAIDKQLGTIPGKLLVFVRYYPQHIFQEEWVYNGADIDGSRIVWARDLGPAENQKLLRYYPDRRPFVVEPDFRPPRLTPYGETPSGVRTTQAEQQ